MLKSPPRCCFASATCFNRSEHFDLLYIVKLRDSRGPFCSNVAILCSVSGTNGSVFACAHILLQQEAVTVKLYL